MAITFGQNKAAQGPTSTSDAVTAAADFSGCSLLVACTFANDGVAAISDTQGNTWETVTTESTSIFSRVSCVRNPSVSASQQFTASGANRFAAIAVLGFIGTSTSAAVDGSNHGSDGTGFNVSTGAITPSASDVVVVSFSGGTSVDQAPAGYTKKDDLDLIGGQAYGVASAYKIFVGSAGSPNLTWTGFSGGIMHAHIAAFDQSTGGGGGGALPFLTTIGAMRVGGQR